MTMLVDGVPVRAHVPETAFAAARATARVSL